MSNEMVAKELKVLSYDLWECQEKLSKKNKEGDKTAITSLSLIHEYEHGDSTAFIQCTVTKQPTHVNVINNVTTQLDAEEHLKYDPDTVNEIISELLRATTERIDFIAMGDGSISDGDIRELFVHYFNTAMIGMGVECCRVTASVANGVIDKVIVTVS